MCAPSCPNACLNASLRASHNHVTYVYSLQCLCVLGLCSQYKRVSVCQHMCCMASPYITSCQGSTVGGLEGLPRLPSQHREQSEALFNPAECTSHICLPACLHRNPSTQSLSFLCCSLSSLSLLSLSLPLSCSFFIVTPPLCHLSGFLFFGEGGGCRVVVCFRLMLFVSFIVIVYL